jgi:alkylation response protein AidB-like acyl-CoA dehydrogenase
MDAFLTAEQRALRQKVRDFFQGGARELVAESTSLTELSREMARHLAESGSGDYRSLPSLGKVHSRLFDWALVVEEVSSVSPRFGQALASTGVAKPRRYASAAVASKLAWTMGTAAHVLEACYRAAREKGLFESTLMDFREAQARLAAARCGLEAVRLFAYRVFQLLDGNGRPRGEEELGPALARALVTSDEVRALASALFGRTWIGPPDFETSAGDARAERHFKKHRKRFTAGAKKERS